MASRTALGERIRALRNAKKVSGNKLSKLLGINQSTLSRIESGRLKPEIGLVKQIISILELTRREAFELTEFAENFLVDFDRWRNESSGTIAKLQRIAQRREANSTNIDTFSYDLIPGLLQTSNYMRDLFLCLGESNPEAINRAIVRRLERQKILEQSKRHFRWIIFEAALQGYYASEETMKEQVSVLSRWVSTTQPFQLRILPKAIKVSSCPLTGFSVFDRRLVTIETITRGINIWSEEEIGSYASVYERLWDSGVADDVAREILAFYQ